ncbi:putative thiol:disulfide interchange protein [Hyphomonas polymorpha PS728]|uniref:Putative thiol:disulfide interchange protein n=1 Tax=Hyphomonas polymorpha PS728 TaxID=1280954 RepID=A0A062VCV7_9PROT|nr:TlpA disulfide reductase family protein [Hyphomonas polymorpha]KCZ97221.1 putative thiol:disulfide interchange protein [Hyphomonas polymorpha PS728]
MTRYAYFGLFLVALAAIVYVLMSAATGKPDGNSYQGFAKGEMAKLDFGSAGQPIPAGTFTDTDTTQQTLEIFKGKTILVNYWATWCPPCEKEMPALGALQTARASDKFEVVALSVDSPEDAEYAKRRLTELGAANIAFRHAPMDNGDVIYGAGVRGFPTTILYGPDGIEIARLAGDADWASADAVQFIDAAIKNAAR